MDTAVKRNLGIDILKALSVISVIIYHLYEYKGTYIGVIVFFVISGYFITSILVEREESYFSFISKRFSKIYPMLIAVLTSVILIFFLFNGYLTLEIIYSSLSALFGLSNIYQIQNNLSYFERSGDMFPLLHTWTLSIEIQFYLIFPLLIYILKKLKLSNKKNSLIIFFLASMSMGMMYQKSKLGYDINNLYYGTDTRIFSLLIGAVFYYRFKNIEVDKKKLNIFASISLFLIVVATLYVDYTMKINYQGLLFFLSILAGIVIIATIKGNFLSSENRLFKVLAGLGKHSYSYYLWQYPIMIFTEEYFKWSDIKYSYSVVIQVIILILISEISYIFLEKRVKMAKILQRLFLLTYLVVIFFLPISEETNSKIIENRIKEVELEMQTEELLKEIEKDVKKSANKSENIIDNEDSENIDNFEKRLLNSDFENPKIEKIQKIDKENKTEIIKEKKNLKEESLKNKEIENKNEVKKVEIEKKEIKIENKAENKTETKKEVRSSTTVKYIEKKKYTFIGDSVMKGAEPYIKEIFINSNVDAKVSRQFTNLPEILNDLKSKNLLNNVVIVHLGSNGLMDKKSFEKSMKILENKKVYFVNTVVPKFWEKTVNNNLDEWSKEYSNTKVIDWYKRAKGKKEMFYKDAVHPNKTGAKIYAEFIYENIK